MTHHLLRSKLRKQVQWKLLRYQRIATTSLFILRVCKKVNKLSKKSLKVLCFSQKGKLKSQKKVRI